MSCTGECTRKYYEFNDPPSNINNIKTTQVPATGAPAPAAVPASNQSADNQKTITGKINSACEKLKLPPRPTKPAEKPDYGKLGTPGAACQSECKCSPYDYPVQRTEIPLAFSTVSFTPFTLNLGGTEYSISGTIEVKETEYAIGHCVGDPDKTTLTLPILTLPSLGGE
jgi:hypothetical protein